ncbi:MAG: geranylgeranylglyceryl/heptaprenylglyceryl phosphate synthase [Chlorobi bacterium]|nr:geranylgeranylglyceryl/heptaprenylglyceryl phosphate synthase [Chlorobiota bacterium]
MLLNLIYNAVYKKKKLFALLIDPGKINNKTLQKTVLQATEFGADILFVGGSIVNDYIDDTILFIKSFTNIPVFLFPGNLLQLSKHADGVILLSLISGRNPELLIGNHVSAAFMLKKTGIEIIPTGYIIIGNNNQSAVSYMSNTLPIPDNKPEIVVATALAGEMLGLKLIYLEAGSGVNNPVNVDTIKKVKNEVEVPLVVGGGLKDIHAIDSACKAGADIIVIGNSIENDISLLKPFIEKVHSY